MTLLQWFALLFCGSVGVFTVLLFWCCCVLAGRADRAGGWVEEDTVPQNHVYEMIEELYGLTGEGVKE